MFYLNTLSNSFVLGEKDENGRIIKQLGFPKGGLTYLISNNNVKFYLKEDYFYKNLVWSADAPLLIDGVSISIDNLPAALKSIFIQEKEGVVVDTAFDSESLNAIANAPVTNRFNEIEASQDAIEDKVDTLSGEIPTRVSELINDAGYITAADVPSMSGKLDTSIFESYSAATASELLNYFDGVEYDSQSKRINFKHGNTINTYIDATDFIKDGMVSNVEIVNGNLVITFNSDSGKEAISIPLTDIFNPNNYYTKVETDALLDEKLDASAYTPSQDVIVDTELSPTSKNPVENKAIFEKVTLPGSGTIFTEYSTSVESFTVPDVNSIKLDVSELTYTSPSIQFSLRSNSGDTYTNIGNGVYNFNNNEWVLSQGLGDVTYSIENDIITFVSPTQTIGYVWLFGFDHLTTLIETEGYDWLKDVVSAHTANTDIHFPITDVVTTGTTQNINGQKTFIGNKRIKFKKATSADALGFTLYDQNNGEIGYFEGNGSYNVLGCYWDKNGTPPYVGFKLQNRYSSAVNGYYNFYTPRVTDVKTSFPYVSGLTENTFYAPLGWKVDNNTIVTTDNTGVVDLSSYIGGGGNTNVIELTQAEYDALTTIDPTAIYVITDAEEINANDYVTKAANAASGYSYTVSLNSNYNFDEHYRPILTVKYLNGTNTTTGDIGIGYLGLWNGNLALGFYPNLQLLNGVITGVTNLGGYATATVENGVPYITLNEGYDLRSTGSSNGYYYFEVKNYSSGQSKSVIENTIYDVLDKATDELQVTKKYTVTSASFSVDSSGLRLYFFNQYNNSETSASVKLNDGKTISYSNANGLYLTPIEGEYHWEKQDLNSGSNYCQYPESDLQSYKEGWKKVRIKVNTGYTQSNRVEIRLRVGGTVDKTQQGFNTSTTRYIYVDTINNTLDTNNVIGTYCISNITYDSANCIIEITMDENNTYNNRYYCIACVRQNNCMIGTNYFITEIYNYSNLYNPIEYLNDKIGNVETLLANI